jgi:hypothetical protein
MNCTYCNFTNTPQDHYCGLCRRNLHSIQSTQNHNEQYAFEKEFKCTIESKLEPISNIGKPIKVSITRLTGDESFHGIVSHETSTHFQVTRKETKTLSAIQESFAKQSNNVNCYLQ